MKYVDKFDSSKTSKIVKFGVNVDIGSWKP